MMMSVPGFEDKKMRSSLPDFGHLTTNETAQSKTRTVFSFRFETRSTHFCVTPYSGVSTNLATVQLPPPHQSPPKNQGPIPTLILNRTQQRPNPRKRKNYYEMLSAPVQMALISCSNRMFPKRSYFIRCIFNIVCVCPVGAEILLPFTFIFNGSRINEPNVWFLS